MTGTSEYRNGAQTTRVLFAWFAAAFIVLPCSLQAQATGRLTGTLIDSQTGGAVSMAQVSVEGTDIGGLSDLKGRYHLSGVPPGTYNLVIEMLGYARKTVTGVQVQPGRTTTLDITLAPEAIQLDEIIVTVDAERGSAANLLNEQRTASSVTDAIGSEDISRSPDSDAAESARRITGVTVVEGRYVYVRGLGERYSQTSLNGSPLPSPEPEKSVVPLDLFPAGFLQSLTTQKTYTPDQPGDFSGGTVEIATKEFPIHLTWKFSIGTSFNTESQFDGSWLSAPGGSTDFLGFDDGSRDLPDAIEQELGGLRGERLPSDPAVRERLGESFLGNDLSTFSPTNGTTPANTSGSLSMGNRTSLFGKDFGYLVAATYSNKFTLRDREIERKWRASNFDPSIPENRRDDANVDYVFTRGIQNVGWGAIGNFNMLLSPTHQLSLRTLYNRSAEDEARRFFGANREDLGGLLVDERIRFIGRSLAWGQLGGQHEFGGVTLEWKGALARATRDEPGLRETIFKRAFSADEEEPFILDNTGESARYLFSELAENDANAQVDLTLPLAEIGGRETAVKVGGMLRRRTRDFAARRFRFEFLSGSTITDLEAALSEETVVGRVEEPGQFALTEIVEPGDVYDVEDETFAGYTMVDAPLASWFRFVGGVRVEDYDLSLVAQGDGNNAALKEADVLPAVNLTFGLSDRMNVRAAWSQTLDRPEFRELAPFQFTEAASLRQIFGNPDLEIAEIQNLDLRWEWFPRAGEVYTLGTFYKHFNSPIEQVFIATAGTAYSYQNAEDADLYGVEFGLRKRLGPADSWLGGFTFQGNAAFIESEVRVRTGGIFDPTNLERKLEGQSPWTLNTNLTYEAGGANTEVGLFFNMNGERIVAAGGSQVPDIVEQPRAQLDFTFGRDLWRGLRLKFKAENLLDAEHRWEQEANGITQIQRSYQTGQTFAITVSYGR